MPQRRGGQADTAWFPQRGFSLGLVSLPFEKASFGRFTNSTNIGTSRVRFHFALTGKDFSHMDILDFTMNTEDPGFSGSFHPCMEMTADRMGGLVPVFLTTGGFAGYASGTFRAFHLRGGK